MDKTQQLYLQKLDTKFTELLECVSPLFSSDALGRFREYIGVGEYGLALDEIQGVFGDKGQTVPPSVLQRMKELADTMEYPLHEPFASKTA